MSADRASGLSILSAIEEVPCPRHRSLSMPVALANLRRPALLLIEQFRTALQDELQSRTPRQRQETICVPLTDGQRQHVTGRTHYYLFQSEPIPPTSLKTRILPWSLSASAFLPHRWIFLRRPRLFSRAKPLETILRRISPSTQSACCKPPTNVYNPSASSRTPSEPLFLKAFDPDAIATLTASTACRKPQASIPSRHRPTPVPSNEIFYLSWALLAPGKPPSSPP